MTKSKKSAKTPRKRLTSERPLKNWPADPEPPESTAASESKETPEPEQLKLPGRSKKPRQARLPEMEDPEIEELETAAEEYATTRDKRMMLTIDETSLKEELLALMKQHKKTTYVHDGFDIRVIVEAEKIRVRIKKDKGE
jgi:hypothetical protein